MSSAEESSKETKTVPVRWEEFADDCGKRGRYEGHSLWSYGDAIWRLGGSYVGGDDDDDDDEAGAVASTPVLAELWKLAHGSRVWERVPCTGDVPHAVANAVVCPVDNGDRVVVFGGFDEYSDELFSNALHVLDMRTFKWTIPEVTGEYPSPRDKAMACSLGENNSLLLVFGGFGPVNREQAEIVRKKRRMAEVLEEGGDAEDLAEAEQEDADEEEEDGGEDAEDAQLQFSWFNEAFVLDCKAMAWNKYAVSGGDVPIERCAAAMCATDAQHALLFGGRCIDGERANDCWQATVSESEKAVKWQKLDTTNTPGGRSFHTMVFVHTDNGDKKDCAVVCGGLSSSNTYYGDVCILDMKSLKWTVYNALDGFVPRENHRATVVCSEKKEDESVHQRMVMYGGGSVIDLHTGAPTQILSDTVAIDITKLV